MKRVLAFVCTTLALSVAVPLSSSSPAGAVDGYVALAYPVGANFWMRYNDLEPGHCYAIHEQYGVPFFTSNYTDHVVDTYRRRGCEGQTTSVAPRHGRHGNLGSFMLR